MTGNPKAGFTCCQQADALIERFKPIYIFGKRP